MLVHNTVHRNHSCTAPPQRAVAFIVHVALSCNHHRGRVLCANHTARGWLLPSSDQAASCSVAPNPQAELLLRTIVSDVFHRDAELPRVLGKGAMVVLWLPKCLQFGPLRKMLPGKIGAAGWASPDPPLRGTLDCQLTLPLFCPAGPSSYFPCVQSASSYSTLMETTLSGEKVASVHLVLHRGLYCRLLGGCVQFLTSRRCVVCAPAESQEETDYMAAKLTVDELIQADGADDGSATPLDVADSKSNAASRPASTASSLAGIDTSGIPAECPSGVYRKQTATHPYKAAVRIRCGPVPSHVVVPAAHQVALQVGTSSGCCLRMLCGYFLMAG